MNYLDFVNIKNYINGAFIDAIDGAKMDNIDPSIGEAYGTIPLSKSVDVASAVEAAEKALPEWSIMNADKRSAILLKIADLIDENLEALALAESIDNGKPLKLATHVDIPRASSNFRFFATGLLHFASESHSMEDTAINYTLRQPVGIVGCISPWNLPLYLFTWKIAPALAAGNCVIAKPSEVTPLTAYLLAHLCKQAGLPDGVLNILHGDGLDCGKAIVSHEKIKAISFTGSTRAGKDIAQIAAPMFKKLSLELGGKNPTIVMADCDWSLMMKTIVTSSFSNQGQICLCGSRILIHSSVYEKFKTEFIAAVAKIKVGDPLLEDSRMGAIVSEVHYHKIMSCIELAKGEGGKILTGGNAIKLDGKHKNGFYIQPTVLENLGPNTRTNQEEIFGPVVTLQSFETEEEALALANASEYGLAATLWTQDIAIAHRMAQKINCGIVWINCWLLRDLRTPFGGMKNSGVGREGGWDAMKFFTETKNVCVKF
jgi:aminomuconate-semialdehyde/2-hydroxymuconate-6-semialdehyde dehydrogenase